MRTVQYKDTVLLSNDHIIVLLTTGTGNMLRRAGMVPTLTTRPAVTVWSVSMEVGPWWVLLGMKIVCLCGEDGYCYDDNDSNGDANEGIVRAAWC